MSTQVESAHKLAGESHPADEADGAPTPPGDGRLARAKQLLARRRSRGAKEPRETTSWSHGSGLATAALRVGMAGALVCGPVALVLGGQDDPPPPPASSGFDGRMMDRRDAAADMGSRWVRSWLTATRDRAGGLSTLGFDTSGLQLPEKAAEVDEMAVVQAVPSATGTWSITVRAQVRQPGQSESTARFFSVPVVVSGGNNAGGRVSARPLTLPAEIPAPSTSVGQRLVYGDQLEGAAGPTSTVTGFLQALLAGQGEVSRYTAPSTSIPVITPPPWERVRLQQLRAAATDAGLVTKTPLADGTTIHVLATVELTRATPEPGATGSASSTPTPSGASSNRPSASPSSTAAPSPVQDSTAVAGSTTAQYELVLVARGGRWEVSAMQSAPQVSRPASTTGSN